MLCVALYAPPPACVVATVTMQGEGVKDAGEEVMSGCGRPPRVAMNWTLKFGNTPVTTQFPEPIEDKPVSAVCREAAEMLYASADVVCPPKDSVKVPPVGRPVTFACVIAAQDVCSTTGF